MEAQKTMDVLSDDQRPKLLYFSGYEDISARVKQKKIDLMAYKLASDTLESHGQALVADPRRDATLPKLTSQAVSMRITVAMCSYGGAGTYLIYTDGERVKLLQDLRGGGILRRTLSSMTEDNKHLRPASIIVSELIEDPIGTWGLSFVTERAHIPRCHGAHATPKAILHRQLGAVRPRKRVKDQVHRVKQLCLPLLRTHFTSRGLKCAATFIRTPKTREQFIDMCGDRFYKGRICILSWYDDPVSNISFGNAIVGAEDIRALGEEVQRIRNISQEVSF
ncbi:hypothetical protein GGR55DRAFT_677293 [Xylaria sp. FL0064]|nr:hypothetical protein GGR55DRAFT_677293 [Xylaria sp. FL0064]